MKLFDAPQVTLISRPEFVYPEHIDWESDSYNDAEILCETSGRLCYLSFGKGELHGHKTIRGRSTNDEYLKNIIRTGHGSVLEHANYSLLIEGVSRALTHELVRHRAGNSFSQLSQRYVDESEIGFVIPPELLPYRYVPGNVENNPYTTFVDACKDSLESYRQIMATLNEDLGDVSRTARVKRVRQAARAILPNAAETKIVMTGNVRSWRHFLELRAAAGADLEIRRLALTIYDLLKAESPVLFGDFERKSSPDGYPTLNATHYRD